MRDLELEMLQFAEILTVSVGLIAGLLLVAAGLAQWSPLMFFGGIVIGAVLLLVIRPWIAKQIKELKQADAD